MASHGHSHNYFHPISFSASEDLWQLPHNATASSEWDQHHHFDGNRHHSPNQYHHEGRNRTWSEDTNTVPFHIEIERQGENSTMTIPPSARNPPAEMIREEGRGRCPLGERTNTIKRYA